MELSLFDLLTLPISFPFKGFYFILETIKKEADKELLNPQNIKDKLLELEYLYEMEDISEEEYLQIKEILLNALREFKEEQLAE